jgi:hypothetical protein
MSDSKMPISRAILWILVSTLCITGSAFMGWLYYLHVRDRRYHDDQYRIVALIQSTPQADALKSVYLAELLGLSLDHPINLYQFNLKEATSTLLRHPLIKVVTMRKILPGSLYIDYEMRTPFAYVGDFANTVIDEEGVLFPFRPFFTPKRLPTIYLGLDKEKCKWGTCVKTLTPNVQLAFDLLCQFEQLQLDRFELKQLDVTQAQADSYGLRQVVMVLEEKSQDLTQNQEKSLIFLRLSDDHAEQDLVNFRTLQASLCEKSLLKNDQPLVVDLRIPHLAFISSAKSK